MASATQQTTPGQNQDGAFDAARVEGFGERLAAAIEAKGWTLARAAREISRHLPPGEVFNPVNLSHYIHGRSFPRPKYRAAIIRALDLDEFAEVAERRPFRTPVKHDSPEIVVQDMGNGTARVQIDQVLPWPEALRLLELLMQRQN
jgi:hypothetical protein